MLQYFPNFHPKLLINNIFKFATEFKLIMQNFITLPSVLDSKKVEQDEIRHIHV
jgi:hypothetical protein